MSANRGTSQRSVRILAAVMLCLGVVMAVGSPAGADPYPPVLPTGPVPAVATVPAPALGGPGAPEVRYGAQSPVIAPGSYPVQARTGAGPAHRETAGTATSGVVIGLLLLGSFLALNAVRRIRIPR